jgi:hypothetical protein
MTLLQELFKLLRPATVLILCHQEQYFNGRRAKPTDNITLASEHDHEHLQGIRPLHEMFWVYR